jgi:hypothetical protein
MTASAQAGSRQRLIGGGRRDARNSPALPGTRWMSVVRAGYGVVLLLWPGLLITAVTDAPASLRVRTVARVLGARHVAQATICGMAPARALIQAGAAVDGLHAASMLVLAGAEPRLRRALLADATLEAAFALAATASLRR